MDVEEVVEQLFGHGRERDRRAHAGVVDEEVEAVGGPLSPQGVGEAADEVLESGDVARIEPQAGGLAAGVVDGLHDRFGVRLTFLVGDDHGDAFGGQAVGHVFAESAAAAGDERDLHTCRLRCFAGNVQLAATLRRGGGALFTPAENWAWFLACPDCRFCLPSCCAPVLERPRRCGRLRLGRPASAWPTGSPIVRKTGRC